MTATAELHIYGPVTKLVGDYPRNAVREVTSYPVAGAQFTPSYRKGLWDGRKHLFRAGTGMFPTGLLGEVENVLQLAGIDYKKVDHRTIPEPKEDGFDLEGVTLRDYQLDAVKKAVAAKQGILRIGTGGGKTECACAITKYLGLRTLFMVTTRELLYQTRDRFLKRLGASEDEIGIIGDGHWKPGTWVTIATVDTLSARLDHQECQDLLKNTEVLFADESHHMGSDTWYQVCMMCNAEYRYGLSGTPLDRTDGANLRLLAAIGPIIVDISNKFLVERGVLAKTHIIFTKVTQPVLKKKLAYATAYKQGVVDNEYARQLVLDWTKCFYNEGLSTLILVEELTHGRAIDEALWTQMGDEFIPHLFIHGEEDTDTRAQALKDFGERRLPVLIASRILDEGVDVPTIDALILAGSRKSRIKTMQRLGRGLRGDKLIAVEFANFTNDYLLRHSLQRYEDYKKEDCFFMYQSQPDQELVRRLWHESD